MVAIRSWVLAAILAGAVAPPGTLCAQRLSRLHPGQRIRVTIPSLGLNRHVVAFAGARPDTVVLRAARFAYAPGSGTLEGDSAELTAPLAAVEGLELSGGVRHLTGTGGLLGGIAGTILGSALADRAVKRCEERGGVLCGGLFGQYYVMPALLGMFAGATVGALIGHAITYEKWEPVLLDHAQVGLSPLPGGRLGLGMALAF